MGGPRRLTDSQTIALEKIATSTETIQERERWIADVRAREIEPLETKRDALIVAAVNAGVPKSWIYTHEALGTVNPYAVEQAIIRYETRMKSATPEIVHLSDEQYRVEIRGFDSIAAAQPDYPAVLAGTITRDATTRSGWRVDHDEDDRIADGTLVEGFLRFELGRSPDEQQSLAAYIGRALAAQSIAA